MKIAFLSGKPKDGTLLPIKEKYMWKEIIRVFEDELNLPFFKDSTFLIPIFNKFDLYALNIAEKNHHKVEYYLPHNDWGTKSLPLHQILLIQRVSGERKILGTNIKRIYKMIEDADVVFVLPNTQGIDNYKNALKNKLVYEFPVHKLAYKTEEEAQIFFDTLKQKTELSLDLKEMKELQKEKWEEEAFQPIQPNQDWIDPFE